MKGTKLDLFEVKEFDTDRWAIMGSSNGSISYYADSKEDAEKTLKLWETSKEMHEALKHVKMDYFGAGVISGATIEMVIESLKDLDNHEQEN